MRSPTSLVSAWYARLCLSFTIHVEYSFCRIRLPATGLTLPWQLVAAHEPGPMYLLVSLFASAAFAGPFSPAEMLAEKVSAEKSAAHNAARSQ